MHSTAPALVADLVSTLLGSGPPIRIEAYDGSCTGPADAPAVVRIRDPRALHRVLAAPGELGFARAVISGDIDLQGDVYEILRQHDRISFAGLRPGHLMALSRLVGPRLLHPPAPPAEEARLHGRRHTRSRDSAAVTHHYDVSNEFYRLLLGPTMTYSCGVWETPQVGLDAAQAAKYELICRKLALEPGMRLLDVGCGWGGMAIHAARHHGVRAVGVTISARQAELARERVAAAGLADRVEVRLADYRDVTDGPYEAISSIGMFEHVGAVQLAQYVTHLHELLAPGGRLLNHGISRPPTPRSALPLPLPLPLARLRARSFVQRYVFPDGELHEIGAVTSQLQRGGLEVRAVESLREHYALTLRAWVTNLEARYDEAVALVGPGRTRVWHLYLAGSALGFESGDLQIHQALAVRPAGGRSGMPLRPRWETRPLAAPGLAEQVRLQGPTT
jgi:cyclopropane-fatty-acyl-phospholipid synthase